MSLDRNEMIEQVMPKAQMGARKYARIYRRNRIAVSYDDCLSAAYEGLVYAAQKFDPDRGASFYSYAYFWMDQHLRRLGLKERRAKGWAYSSKAQTQAGYLMVKVATVQGMPRDFNGHEREPAAPRQDVDAVILRRQMRDVLLSSCATAQHRAVIDGMLAGRTPADISREIGRSRQRVGQLADDVKRRVRERLAGAV